MTTPPSKTLVSMLRRRALHRIPGTVRRSQAARAAARISRLTEQTYGHYASARSMESIGRDGQPVPWYTYPAIEWLLQLRLDAIAVLEFGSGNSTRWWAARTASVTAIEDDPVWYSKIGPTLPANVDYRLAASPAEYTEIAGETYGIVVVDGSHRYDCARIGIRVVDSGGMIVLDNADWHPRTAMILRDAGLAQIDFIGPGPINPYPWATSVFLANGGIAIPHADGVRVSGGIVQLGGSDAPSASGR